MVKTKIKKQTKPKTPSGFITGETITLKYTGLSNANI